MVLVESDRQDISICILDICESLGIDLNESTRNMLNAKALGIFCRERSMEAMRTQIKWEIAFLAPKMLKRGSDRELILGKGELRKEKAIAAYLRGIGCDLYRDGETRWTIVPRAYDSAAVVKRVNAIKNS